MIAALTARLFFEILVHVLNIASAKARAKTVFGHLKRVERGLDVSILLYSCLDVHCRLCTKVITLSFIFQWT